MRQDFSTLIGRWTLSDEALIERYPYRTTCETQAPRLWESIPLPSILAHKPLPNSANATTNPRNMFISEPSTTEAKRREPENVPGPSNKIEGALVPCHGCQERARVPRTAFKMREKPA